MTTCDQLNKYCKAANGYIGCFASDKMPKIKGLETCYSGDVCMDLKKRNCFIINYDRHDQKGSHWVCVIVEPYARAIEYFDSFGLPPDGGDEILGEKTHFKDFINNIKNHFHSKFKYNKKQMQDINDDECGEYCALVCNYGMPVNNVFWSRFLNMPRKIRDAEVKKYCKTLLN